MQGEYALEIPNRQVSQLQRDVLAVRRLVEETIIRVQLPMAARKMANNRVGILPSETVETLCGNGLNWGVISEMRRAKNRKEDQREGIIASPSITNQFVDYKILSQIQGRSEQEMRDLVMIVYSAAPCGLILPVEEKLVPSHLITYHERGGQRLPTILAVWNARYKPWRLFEDRISQYSHVLWAGTSAPAFQEAVRLFGPILGFKVNDPLIDRHVHPGSYPHFDLSRHPIVLSRDGYLDRARDIQIINRLKVAIPNLAIPE